MDELVRTALSEEWRNTFALSGEDKDTDKTVSSTNVALPKTVSDVSLAEENRLTGKASNRK